MSGYYILTPDGELYHHGIKGQKWGVRRYQNKDGSLTPAGQKKYGKQYKKYMQKTQAAQRQMYQKMVIDAHNETADEYNAYKIAEYNKKHSPDDPDYVDTYNKQFGEDWHRNYTKKYLEFTKNDKNYLKGKALADKYNLYEYDDLAKSNAEAMDALSKYVDGLLTREEADTRVSIAGSRLK